MVEESYKSQFLGLFDEDLVKKVTSLSMTGPVKSISKEEMNRIADMTQIERSTREGDQLLSNICKQTAKIVRLSSMTSHRITRVIV